MSSGVITATIIVLVSLVVIRKVRGFQWGKCRSENSMRNKVIIVTGANTGIGKATTEELVKRGACVIMACRDTVKALLAVAEIRKRTQNGVLKVQTLDLSSFSSIKRFAEHFIKTEEKLDVLINNAGIFQCPFKLTEDGHESQFGVNHLGHFLLTTLLLDKLKESAPSRIINVSSMLYKKGQLNLDQINSVTSYDKRKAYSDSKLANVLFTRELAKHLQGSAVNVYVISPGMVWTNLGRHIKIPWYKLLLLAPLGFFVIRTPYQGCQTVLHCAISDDVEHETGLYYSNCCKSELEKVGTDDFMAKSLWEYSEKCIAEYKY